MIKKCDHNNCNKAGGFKCPKDRSLKEYWHFCQKHAAEYNANWNYYAGMTQDEIDAEWEKDMFGRLPNDGDNMDYTKMIGDFLSGNAKMPGRKKIIPSDVAAAFRIFDLPTTTPWGDIQKKYRALAKQEHPDANKTKDQSRFSQISSAYHTLKSFFKK